MIPVELSIEAGYWLQRLQRGEDLSASERQEAGRVLAVVYALAQAGKPPRPSDSPDETRARKRRSRERASEASDVGTAAAVGAVGTEQGSAGASVTPVTNVTRDARDLHVTPAGSPPFPPSPPSALPLDPNPTPSSPPISPSPAADAGARVVGTVAGNIPSLAVMLAVAANQGVAAVLGEQPSPYRHDDTHTLDLAELVLREGIDPVLARQSVFTQAKQFCEREREHRRRRRPRTLSYFAEGIRQHAAEATQRAAIAATPAPAELAAARSGRPATPSRYQQLRQQVEAEGRTEEVARG